MFVNVTHIAFKTQVCKLMRLSGSLCLHPRKALSPIDILEFTFLVKKKLFLEPYRKTLHGPESSQKAILGQRNPAPFK